MADPNPAADDASRPENPETPAVPHQRSPDQPAPAAPVPVPGRRHRLRWRQVLLVMVLAGGLLLLGGVGYGFIVYNQATRPDRSAPDVVVDNYLRALLVERDNVQAGLYACGDGARLAEIHALRDDLLSRERQFNITIRVSWGSLTVERDGDRAAVTTNLVRTISDGSEQSVNIWRFEVVDQNGWRVCGGARVG